MSPDQWVVLTYQSRDLPWLRVRLWRGHDKTVVEPFWTGWIYNVHPEVRAQAIEEMQALRDADLRTLNLKLRYQYTRLDA